MSTLLFLGAGASRPFDIPTMQEMVDEFEESLKKDTPREHLFYSKIKKTQQKDYGYSKVDIESVFSVIQGIADAKIPKDMGYLAHYYISSNSIMKEFSREEIEQAKRLKILLEEFIKKKCNSNLNNKKKDEVYSNSYHALFTHLPANPKQGYGDNAYDTQWQAVTTNYDSIFEDFWADYLKLHDHFAPDGQSKHLIFDYNKNYGFQSITKLHGSLDWVKDKNGRILKIGSTGYTRHKIEGEVMLFPIQQKDLYLHPWITLFQRFKLGLEQCNKWIVIGYAFNDEFIFATFVEALKRFQKNLIIINPSAEELKQKFPKEFHDQIITLPIKFGTKYFPIQIQDFFEKTKTLNIRVKTASPLIGFKSSIPIQSFGIKKTEKMKVGQNIITNDRNWAEITVEHPFDVNTEFVLKLKYDPPFDKDLELQIGFSGVYDYSFEVYIDDHFISSKSGNTPQQNDELQKHLGEPLNIYRGLLFV